MTVPSDLATARAELLEKYLAGDSRGMLPAPGGRPADYYAFMLGVEVMLRALHQVFPEWEVMLRSLHTEVEAFAREYYPDWDKEPAR